MSACVRVSLSRDMNGFQSHGMWQGRHRSPWPKHDDEEAATGLPARPPAAQQVRGRGLTYNNPGTANMHQLQNSAFNNTTGRLRTVSTITTTPPCSL